MKRTLIVIFSVLVILTLTFSSALAQNPHFIRASASGSDAAGNLTVSFKILVGVLSDPLDSAGFER